MISRRKFIIWLVSLLVVLALYFVLTWSSGLPKVAIDKSLQEMPVQDSNVGQPSGRVGMIGDVGVGGVQKARFTHLNEKKEIDREFGFEKLLHEVGDEWELEKPFMTIFRKGFECRITADSGKVQVQTAGGRPAPKDASLSGNVVIKIVPAKNSSIGESSIYLDDVIFISDRSQFSTAGPVKFVNADAEMVGKGLELIYNEQTGRLDFLHITRLDNLSLKIPRKKNESAHNHDTGGRLQTAGTASVVSDEQVPQKKGNYYRCALSGNVVITSPEQVVFANELLVSDIFQAKEEKSQGRTERKSAAGGTVAGQTGPAKSEEFTNVNVSCDNGIVVTPMDSNIPYAAPAFQPTTSFEERVAKACDQSNKRAAFAAKKVEYNMAAGTIVLDGDCLCTGYKQETNGQRKYTLSGQKITVTLAREKEKPALGWTEGVKKVVAEGEVVQLATVKMTDDKVMGFTKLKCSKFDYDGDNEQFTAKGPGVIAIDNSKLPQQDKKPRKFALKRQCYAVVRDFETLTYSPKSNQLIADSNGRGLVIDYFPITDGKTGTQVTVNAGRMEAKLLDLPTGGVELMNLTATGGVTYEEKDIQFAGSNLIYDAGKSLINITGDQMQPCILNGSLVDAIIYDLKKDKFNAQIRSPGVLQLK